MIRAVQSPLPAADTHRCLLPCWPPLPFTLLQLRFQVFLPLQVLCLAVVMSALPRPCEGLLGASGEGHPSTCLCLPVSASLPVPARLSACPCLPASPACLPTCLPACLPACLPPACDAAHAAQQPRLHSPPAPGRCPRPVPAGGCLPAGLGRLGGAGLLGLGALLPLVAVYQSEVRSRRRFRAARHQMSQPA